MRVQKQLDLAKLIEFRELDEIAVKEEMSERAAVIKITEIDDEVVKITKMVYVAKMSSSLMLL